MVTDSCMVSLEIFQRYLNPARIIFVVQFFYELFRLIDPLEDSWVLKLGLFEVFELK
jgi:hypothetical protein